MALRKLAMSGSSQASALVIIGLLVAVSGCTSADGYQEGEASTVAAGDSAPPTVVMQPEGGDQLWVFAESKDELGSGGAFQIYVDPVKYPEALASFAKFGMGIGGALPVHRHDKTEEISYFLSGQGTVTVYEDGTREDVAVRAGSVMYTPPGSWHAITNTDDEPLSLIFAAVPNEKKGLLSFFRRIGAKPGEAATELTPEEFAHIAAEHDLILRPPDTEE